MDRPRALNTEPGLPELAATFAVAALRRYSKSSFPDQEVYGSTGHPTLRLVSCGGAFDGATGHYLDNIVVYADLVGA